MRWFLLIVFVLINWKVKAQNNSSVPDTTTAKKIFKQAREKFARFEKEHGGYIQTNNVRMHYLTWGKPSGVPLIWVHGTGQSAYELLPLADSLTKAGYYVVAIDYYGHGLTPIPRHEVSIYHLADDINTMMNKLKIKKAVIGGFSRGGIITSAFYNTYAERVLGLILVDGGSTAPLKHWHVHDVDSLKAIVNSAMTTWGKDTTYATEFEAYYFDRRQNAKKDRFELLARIKHTKDGNWAYDPYLMEWLHEDTPEHVLDNILRPTRVPLFESSTLLLQPKVIYRNLHVPLLIIDPVIENDRFPIEEYNKELQQMHPSLIEHRIYLDTNHGAHLQRPSEFIKDAAAFLKKLKEHHKWK